MEMPRIALIYLTYHSDEFIGRFIDALAQLSYPKDRLTVYVVDHPHPECGSSIPALENVLRDHASTVVLPEIKMFKQSENRGFSGGSNVGMRAALADGAEYVFLHSHDGFLAPNALQKLVQVMVNDAAIGAAQALMCSYPETTQVNNAGGLFHFLGFGSISVTEVRSPASSAGKPKSEVLPHRQASRGLKSCIVGRPADPRDIGYASGGAVLLRAELLRTYGLWDEDYFLYHEDIEYSLRLRSVGYRIVVVPDAILYHHYEFGRNSKKWFFMERNRLGLLLSVYKLPTLCVLFPLGLITEVAVLVFAFQHGWLKEKLAAYRYWLNPAHYPVWLAKRKKFQLQRTVGDRALLQQAVAYVSFAQTDFDSLLMHAGNTVMSALWWIIKKVVWW